MALAKDDFKISTDVNDNESAILVKDISNWGTDERAAHGFLLMHTNDDGLTYEMDYTHIRFSQWTIESLVNGTYEITVYGFPAWSNTVNYSIGDITMAQPAADTTSPVEDAGDWKLYVALTNNTNKRPGGNPTDWKLISSTNYTNAQIKALLDALTDDADYTFYVATSSEVLGDPKITIEKVECNTWKVSKQSAAIDNMNIYTMQQYNENLDPINSSLIPFSGADEKEITLTDYTDADGNPYKDGVYVIKFYGATSNDYLENYDSVFMEICQIKTCVKKVLMDTLCSDCGCDDPCDDTDNNTMRRRRDFLNTILSAFGHLMSLLHEDWSTEIGVLLDSESRRTRLTDAHFTMDKLLDYINTCNLCE